jgi:hypothetical protein
MLGLGFTVSCVRTSCVCGAIVRAKMGGGVVSGACVRDYARCSTTAVITSTGLYRRCQPQVNKGQGWQSREMEVWVRGREWQISQSMCLEEGSDVLPRIKELAGRERVPHAAHNSH